MHFARLLEQASVDEWFLDQYLFYGAYINCRNTSIDGSKERGRVLGTPLHSVQFP